MTQSDLKFRPYLVIPKLIKQPTWGGEYIVAAKGWASVGNLASAKIGQSYELFSGTNLSLLSSSADPAFAGEVTDNVAVADLTKPENSIGLRDLLAKSPVETLGQEVIAQRGADFALLIKFTQALGNSFQVHIRDGVSHPVWKPKPESWYYFEPGLITLGAKPGIDWNAYQLAVESVQSSVESIGKQVASGSLTHDLAQAEVEKVVKQYDPWQYVNTIRVKKGELVDLSSGGLHHSWEEDPEKAPLGNVLYELQAEALDNISTFRSFDKGKMGQDGHVRQLQIEQYFDVIDRSPEVNDPKGHIRLPETIAQTPSYSMTRLLKSRHYNLDKLELLDENSGYSEKIERYKHLFVQSGRIEVSSAGHSIIVTTAHSCFIPAGVGEFVVKNLAPRSELLISY